METPGSAQKAESEMAQPGPVFSYAQAAKGRSPSLSASASASQRGSKPHSEANGPANQRGDATEESEKAALEVQRINESGHLTLESKSMPEPSVSASHNETEKGSKPKADGLVSMPSSPDLSSVSASTIPKEDDLFITTNGSSDSTWDRQSETSQNGEKNSAKEDAEKDGMKAGAWDRTPAAARLKDAPPPSFNIWQQRAEKQAKAVKEPAPTQVGPSSITKPHSQSNGNKKNADIGPDLAKIDNAKKGKPSTQTSEEINPSPSVKETGRFGDRKNRNGEEITETVHRGTRVPDLVKPMSVKPPPPPGDAVSWPTPESAQGEEKRKAQDKGDRSEKVEKEKVSGSKSHGKEKWVSVPYVPSAVFNTPLPMARRGGRTARGGRENGGARGGHASHGSLGGEKPNASNQNTTAVASSSGNERGRTDMGPPRGGSFSGRPRRAASAGAPVSREQRKPTDSMLQDRRNDQQPTEQGTNPNTRNGPPDSRRASTATQTENLVNGLHASTSSGKETTTQRPVNNMSHEDRQQRASHDHAHSRPNGPERRSEGNMRPPDFFRESTSFAHPRERGEVRHERGRGAYRGNRGANGFNGNHAANGPNFHNGNTNNHATSGFTASKTQSYNKHHELQPHGSSFNGPQRESKMYRANSRSQSITNPPTYGRYQNSASSGSQHLPALQTQLANMYAYESGPPGVMSAVPYNPYMEQMQLLGMVQMQMEYYFSLDNLCKDMFLRKHMDSQGFVFLSVVTNFNRIKQLTDDIDLIRYVCIQAPSIDFQTGADGVDRVRKLDGWEQWILSMEERDETARNESPVQMQLSSAFEGPRSSEGRNSMSWRPSFAAPPSRTEDGAFQPVDGLLSYAPNASQPGPKGRVIDKEVIQTPLSAAVPDFAPGISILNNPGLSPLDPHVPVENSFSDEQVESLMIVIRKPVVSATALRAPFPTAASRTFSNGSIDSRTISDEIASSAHQPSVSTTNGDQTLESRDIDGSHRPRSSPPSASTTKLSISSAPPVFWVKDKETPIDDLPSDLTHESYTIFRHDALKEREQSTRSQCHRDMDILYQFWSHFLIRNFNTRMYEEFRHLAFEDFTKRDSSVGIKNLVLYYDESILGQKVISDDLARDYVDLVTVEASRNERLAFNKLRLAWRNGAFNLRNRRKIDKIIDPQLKAELER